MRNFPWARERFAPAMLRTASTTCYARTVWSSDFQQMMRVACLVSSPPPTRRLCRPMSRCAKGDRARGGPFGGLAVTIVNLFSKEKAGGKTANDVGDCGYKDV